MASPYRPMRTPPPGRSPRRSSPRDSPPRDSPPRRSALHERSESRINERSAPMLRMVGDPEAPTYQTTPYPTKPSQVLAPPPTKSTHILAPQALDATAGPPSPYEIVARAQSRLSEHTRDTWIPSNATRARMGEAPHTPNTMSVPEEDAEETHADSTFYTASADGSSTLVDPAQDTKTGYFPSTTTPDLDPNSSFLEPRTSDESSDKGRLSGESVVQLPSVPPRAAEIGYAVSSSMTEPFSAEYPAVPPRAEGHGDPLPSPRGGPFAERQPSNKDSDTSLGSVNSTGTMVVKKPRDGKKRASYSAFPTTSHSRPNSSKSSLPSTSHPPSTPTKLQRDPSEDSAAPVSPVSPSSPASESYATARPISAIPAYTSLQEANSKNVDVQYPVIEPPRVSGSWADTSTPPQRPPKPVVERADRWNPHLSTVQSVGSSSPSADRSSQGTWPLDSSRGSKSSSSLTKWSPRISTDFPPVPQRSTELSPSKEVADSPPIPPFNPARLKSPPPVRQSGFTGSMIRKVDEDESVAPDFRPIRPAPGPSQPSVSPNIQTLSSKPQEQRKGSEASTKRGSNTSFFTDGIPAWAKSYYARPDSAIFVPRSESRTSGDLLQMGVNGRKNSRDILNGNVKGLTLAQSHGPPVRRVTSNWSPHLWHDRTSLGRRRSLFKAPSMDEQAEGKALTKRNAQVVLFAVGFVCPPCKSPPDGMSCHFPNVALRLVRRRTSSTPGKTVHSRCQRQGQRPHINHG